MAIDGEVIGSIPENHMDMCKFGSKVESYLSVVDTITSFSTKDIKAKNQGTDVE